MKSRRASILLYIYTSRQQEQHRTKREGAVSKKQSRRSLSLGQSYYDNTDLRSGSATDAILESRKSSFGSFAHGNDYLFVGHSGTVTCSIYAGRIGTA